MPVLRLGDLIEYVDGFGHGTLRRARIVAIELCDHGKDDGVKLSDVPLDLVQDGFPPLHKGFMLTLDNKKWCYGSQVVGQVTELEGNA